MAPYKQRTEFPAGNQDYRAARLRAAIACQDYNSQGEEASAEQRAALYHAIINAGQSQLQFKAGPTLSTPPLASPLPALNLPAAGSSPDAATSDPSSECSESTTSTPASTAPSDTFPQPKRFPGQGLAPYIKPPLHVDYGSCVDIATSTFINRGCKILDTPVRSVRIGERCLIGPDFSIYAVGHPLDHTLRNGPAGAPSFGMDVTIEDDCWIGGHVTILGGVNVGKGCVIGANSLITKRNRP
ncbi:trimeric LpxA-like protein [Microthyrium microscopicum]|uniref:Trimeric LpxA-like protein n=1 Tax=Microthyrium microscopicum TaxID=703497 RepID=A0A6A6UJ29_9PEZI|nr:trimeric LpxA-like protein [Microthyrium microscopicum]